MVGNIIGICVGFGISIGVSIGINIARLFINLSSYFYKKTILFSLKAIDSTLNRYSSSTQVMPKSEGSIEYFFIFIDSELIPIDFDFEEEIKYTLELTNIDQQGETNSSVSDPLQGTSSDPQETTNSNLRDKISRSITIEKIDGMYVTHTPNSELFVVTNNRLYINNTNFSVFERDYLVEISVTMEC